MSAERVKDVQEKRAGLLAGDGDVLGTRVPGTS